MINQDNQQTIKVQKMNNSLSMKQDMQDALWLSNIRTTVSHISGINFLKSILCVFVFLLFISTVSHAQPTVVNSETAQNNNGGASLTITKPANLQVGDLMIVNIDERGTDDETPSTIPAGWIEVIRYEHASPGRQIWIGYKIAVADDVSNANYTFNWSGADDLSGGITAFRGVDTATNGGIEVEGTSYAASNNDPLTPTSITTLSDNSLVVFLAQVQEIDFNSSSWRLGGSTGTIMTELYSLNPVNKTGVGAAILVKATAGATGSGYKTTEQGRKAGVLLSLKDGSCNISGTSTKTDVTCNGVSDGVITITGSAGGSGNFQYRINSVTWQSSNTFTGLAPNTYTVEMRDASNTTCVISLDNQTIGQPTVLNASVTKTNANCFGSSNGTITVSSPTGGGGTYQYRLDSGIWQNGGSFTGLAAATYSVQIRDAVTTSCVVVLGSQIVTQPAILNATVAKTNITCNGLTNGTITVSSPTGGGGTYEYRLDSGIWQNGGSFTGLSDATYSVQIRDAVTTSCVVVLGDQTITEPVVLNLNVTKTDVMCNGESSGTISVTPFGGSLPYTYAWSDGPITTQNRVALSSGSYTVTVTSAAGCIATATVSLSQPLALVANGVDTPVNCTVNGAIAITMSGGTTPYTYDWADIPGTSNGEDRDNLTAGTYELTVTDANGCTDTYSTTLATPSGCNPDIIFICENETSQTFSVDPDSMVDSYTWTIPVGSSIAGPTDESQVVVDFTGVAPGDYEVCVKAVNVCGESVDYCNPITIKVVNAAASVGDVCEGYNIQLSASGGQSYAWSGPGGYTSTSPNPILYDATVSDNGTYTVTVTDESGCTGTAQVAVAITSAPSLNVTATDATCGNNNGSVDLVVSGGLPSYTYLWNNGATTQDLSAIFSGTYTVTVTDMNGCTSSITAAVSDIEVVPSISAFTEVNCSGESTGVIDIEVTGNAPFTYMWSNGATTQDIIGLEVGNYTVTVTDAGGCIGALTQEISGPNPLQMDGSKIDILCFGNSTGSIDVSVSGGTLPYTFDWDDIVGTDDGEDRASIAAGTYTVIVTDGNDCTAQSTFIIAQPAAGIMPSVIATDVNCFGGSDGSVDLTVSGGTAPFSYLWTDGETTQDIIGKSEGMYTVTITDASGCTNSATATVDQPSLALSASSTQVNVSCNGGANASIDLTVVGGTTTYTFLWSNGATTENLSGLSAGTYSVIVTDANSCTTSATATITEPDLLTASGVENPAVCFGQSNGSIELTVAGGTLDYTYEWSDMSILEDPTGLAAGTYYVTVTDDEGCTAQANVTVTEPTDIVLNGAITNVICNGASTGAIDVSVLGGAGGNIFDWNDIVGTDDGEDRTDLTAGTYDVVLTDMNGCIKMASYTVTESSALVLSTVESNVSCNGADDGEVSLTVTGGVGPYSFLWDNVANDATTKDIDGLGTGTYTVTVTDANLCTAETTSLAITEPTPVIVALTPIDNICFEGAAGEMSSVPSGGNGPYTYAWSEGSTTQNITGLVAGTYTVTVTDANLCTGVGSEVIAEPATAILIESTSIVESCNTSNGSIDLTVSGGGSGPYVFVWDNGAADIEDPTGLAEGTYNVIVTDNLGCDAMATVIVGASDPLVVSVPAFDRTCSNVDGQVFAVVSGEAEPFTYLWSGTGNANGATTQSVTGLDFGTYTVVVTAPGGCTQTAMGTIGIPSCLPPVAQDDNYTTPFETSIMGTVAPIDNMDPGYDSDGDDMLADLVFLPLGSPSVSEGIITWDPSFDGSFTFVPATDFVGVVMIPYQVCDPTDLCDKAILTITVTAAPAILIVKSGPATGNPGNMITYNFSVTNDDTNGDGSPITNVTVTDDIAGATTYLSGDTGNDGILEVGETWLYNVQYTIQADDPDPLVNIATAAGKDLEGDDVNDTDTHSLDILFVPSLTIVKEVDLATVSAPGDLTYTITVDNTGNQDLTNVVITDVFAGGASLTSGDVNMNSILETTEVWIYTATYTVTQADINAGADLVNTAVVDTDQTDPESDDVTTTITEMPSLTIVKEVDLSTVSAPGDLTYTITVDNTGNQDLTNVVITDVFAGGASLTSGDSNMNSILETTEVWIYTATYAVTQADINAGADLVNTAIVDTDQTDPESDDVTTTITEMPSLTIVKEVDLSTVSAPGDLTYTITVDNTGNQDLTNVVITDVFAGGASLTSGDANMNSILETTETWIYTATYTVTQADINAGADLVNTAIVDTDQTDPESDDVTTTITETPSLTIVKEVDLATVSAPGDLTYTITVDNTGNQDLTNVVLTDVFAGGASLTSGDANMNSILETTETWIYTATYTVTQADINAGVNLVNTEVVDTDQTDPESDDVTTTITEMPSLTIVKEVDLATVSAPGDLTYTITVDNTGNQDLTNVVITDCICRRCDFNKWRFEYEFNLRNYRNLDIHSDIYRNASGYQCRR